MEHLCAMRNRSLHYQGKGVFTAYHQTMAIFPFQAGGLGLEESRGDVGHRGSRAGGVSLPVGINVPPTGLTRTAIAPAGQAAFIG